VKYESVESIDGRPDLMIGGLVLCNVRDVSSGPVMGTILAFHVRVDGDDHHTWGGDTVVTIKSVTGKLYRDISPLDVKAFTVENLRRSRLEYIRRRAAVALGEMQRARSTALEIPDEYLHERLTQGIVALMSVMSYTETNKGRED